MEKTKKKTEKSKYPPIFEDIVRRKAWDEARKCNYLNIYTAVRKYEDIDSNAKIIWEHIFNGKKSKYLSIFEDIVKRRAWNEARKCNNSNLYKAVLIHKSADPNAKIIWEHILNEEKTNNYPSILKNIVKRRAWNEARMCNNPNTYNAVIRYKDIDPNAKIIWEHIKVSKYLSIFEDIVKRRAWNEARGCNNGNLYLAVKRYKDKDPNAKIIWEHILKIDYPSIFEDIVKRRAWNEARGCNNNALHQAVIRYRYEDPNAKIISEHIKIKRSKYPSSIFEDIVKKEAWDEARDCNNHALYQAVKRYKDKDPNAKIIWEHIERNSEISQIISDILLHVEDLAYLDKAQLIHVALLRKLDKDIYNEIVNCPKGKERKHLLEGLSDRLSAISDKSDLRKTQEEEFNNEIKTEESAISKEEEIFIKELIYPGFETVKDVAVFNIEDKLEEMYKEIRSLDNLSGYFEGKDVIEYIVKSEVQKLLNIIHQLPPRKNILGVIEDYITKKSGKELFNKIVNGFLNVYREVEAMEIPKGYSYKVNGKFAEPLLMQKLTAYMVKKERQFANWSETGTGKTISGVLTSRVIDSRTTLIIAVNSTIGNWTEKSIRCAYPDSKVYTKKSISNSVKLDRNFHNYIVVNYEEFQDGNKFILKWKPFIENNKIDLVILDEVQKVKSSSKESITIRRGVIENILQRIDLQYGRDLNVDGRLVPVLALSATPVINNLNEAISILSLLRGKELPSIKKATKKSAIEVHFEIVKSGIRLTDPPTVKEKFISFPITREASELTKVIDGKRGSILSRVDFCGIMPKLRECINRGYLRKGVQTIIYTELVTGVIDSATDHLKAYGFRVGEYTGRNAKNRDYEMSRFLNKEIDVLIASKPISTGVDGLQTVCNRMIILVPAWTYSEYHQLVGRINRRGTRFNEVNIIVPTVEYVNDEGEIWSLDANRLAKIWFKKSLMEVTLDGIVPDSILSIEKAKKLAENSLLEYLNLKEKRKTSREKGEPTIAVEIKPTVRKPRVRGNKNQRDFFSELQGLHQRFSTSTIDGIFTKIIKTKEDWLEYHRIRDKAMGTSLENQPITTISRDFLKSKKHKVLGDMGCGENRLKTLLTDNYEVISVDVYGIDETVKECNLLDTSGIISDNSLDVAVYSLSLWGRNWRNILKDAYRILDYDGKIIIAENVRSQSKSIDRVQAALHDVGFINISVVKDPEEKYYYMTANK